MENENKDQHANSPYPYVWTITNLCGNKDDTIFVKPGTYQDCDGNLYSKGFFIKSGYGITAKSVIDSGIIKSIVIKMVLAIADGLFKKECADLSIILKEEDLTGGTKTHTIKPVIDIRQPQDSISQNIIEGCGSYSNIGVSGLPVGKSITLKIYV